MIALRDHTETPSRHSRRSAAFDQTATRTKQLPACAALQPAPNAIVSRLAHNRVDLYAALRLVYNAYLETGLIDANPYELRATRYHLLPTTDVFLATRNHELLGTLSLVRDGAMGLPMEDVYGTEVAARRRKGVTMAEVSCLAVGGHGKESMLAVVVQLMSHMAQFAARHHVDELLIAVHPHHVGFYERFTGFEVVGGMKSYSAVRDNPAVALALDLKHGEVNHPRAYHRFFGKRLPDRELLSPGMDDATLAELHWIVELTNATNQPTRRKLDSIPAAA